MVCDECFWCEKKFVDSMPVCDCLFHINRAEEQVRAGKYQAAEEFFARLIKRIKREKK